MNAMPFDNICYRPRTWDSSEYNFPGCGFVHTISLIDTCQFVDQLWS